MKKQSIVLGSMFVVGLLLLVPNVSAVEFKALSDTDLIEDELRESILERIDELREKNPSLTFAFNWDDPDGPFEGGLDDFSDWTDVGWSLTYVLMMGYFTMFDLFKLLVEENAVLAFVEMIVLFSLTDLRILLLLGDAFDIIDFDNNGC